MIDLNPKQIRLVQWYILILAQSGKEYKLTQEGLKETVFLTCNELVRLDFQPQ